MTCAETAACARIDGSAWLGRDHAADIEIATALEDSLAYNINISSSFLYTYYDCLVWVVVVDMGQV